ncbi:alpha/beta fold hydrolase [Microbacterium xanthum]|uniref:alpha/beta fold hydrolase n=1 Tax=Microbacterium xanthum TaxID=3079794 RepID=UPI002AD29137|nr:alpha/beta fold hydrolase [Microbacterium sp. KSW-48]MDZ8171572.1 alpha/beta fold hydrolase [Microbacterium sp. KSW-48]
MSGRLVHLPSGRSLGVTGFGDPVARRVVLLCHPSPGTGGFDPDPTVTSQWGARLVALDRPGYGASEPWRSPDHASFTAHADDLAQHLSRIEAGSERLDGADIGSIGVVGWGLGGYAALALAARHPHLVDRLALVDTPSPESARRAEVPSAPFSFADIGFAPREPAYGETAAGRRLGRMLAAAATQGDAGVRGDREALEDDLRWRSLRDVEADTLLVYGDEHPTVSAHLDGRRLRRRIPGSRVVRVARGTGLSISTHWPSILNHVAPRP